MAEATVGAARPLVSRDEALALGLPRYFTGQPCVHGHIAERHTPSKGCIVCRLEYQRRYFPKYRADNREAINAANRAWRERNTEYHRAYAEANRERIRKHKDKYAKANPDVRRAIKARRRAREADGGGYTAAELQALVRRQRFRCAYCPADLRKTGYHADHRVPLAKGGQNVISNIQALCPTCNRRKSARDPIEFAQAMGLLL